MWAKTWVSMRGARSGETIRGGERFGSGFGVRDYPKANGEVGLKKPGVSGFPFMVKSAQMCFEWM